MNMMMNMMMMNMMMMNMMMNMMMMMSEEGEEGEVQQMMVCSV